MLYTKRLNGLVFVVTETGNVHPVTHAFREAALGFYKGPWYKSNVPIYYDRPCPHRPILAAAKLQFQEHQSER